MFCLVDSNNFYVSCERVFQPKLEGKPVIVLSSNDGCAIARSNEAKLLGVKMGQPVFLIKDLIAQHNIQLFSANFALYGEMSDRIMRILGQCAPRIEIYSIDEAFLDFTGFDHVDLVSYGHEIRNKLKTWVGIPTSIGFAPTKTLAKIAGHMAKTTGMGVFNLANHPEPDSLLASFPVEEIWGVGRQYAKHLKHNGIFSALDLKHMPLSRARQLMKVMGARMVQELQGVSCLELEDLDADKQTTTVSRTFGKAITDLEYLKHAIACFTVRACEKIRKSGLQASAVSVFMRTGKFHKGPRYGNSIVKEFMIPTNDSRLILQLVLQALTHIYKPGYAYAKAGVCLLGLCRANTQTADLFALSPPPASQKLMQAIDQINSTMGQRTLIFGAQGLGQGWSPNANKRSPRYTTDWKDIPRVN